MTLIRRMLDGADEKVNKSLSLLFLLDLIAAVRMLDHRSLLGRLSFTTGVYEATLKCSTLYRVNYQAQCGCSQLFLFLRDPPDALIMKRDFSWAEVLSLIHI